VKDLAGSVAIVTGGASGVGFGIADVLAREGAAVVVVDRDFALAQRAVSTLEADGGALALEADVVERPALDLVVREVLGRYGRVDVLAANAGIFPSASLEEIADADWDAVMDVNVKGVLHSIQACVPPMRAQQYGRIVITSSITGPIVGAPKLSHYAASKSALLGLMRSAALELVGDGITVNAVQPGNVRTPGIESFGQAFIDDIIESIPMRRLAEPTEVGWAVRFLGSEEAGYITGQTIVIDGGQVLPEGGADVEA
jgi:3-oxoacyl-[acyl-carrier protein] reductase